MLAFLIVLRLSKLVPEALVPDELMGFHLVVLALLIVLSTGYSLTVPLLRSLLTPFMLCVLFARLPHVLRIDPPQLRSVLYLSPPICPYPKDSSHNHDVVSARYNPQNIATACGLFICCVTQLVTFSERHSPMAVL